jgi:hypothetical protein
MLRTSTLLALAAVAALGLAIGSADAKPAGPGFGPNKGPGFNPGVVKPGGIKVIPSNPIVVKPGGIKVIPSNPIVAKPKPPIFHPHWPKPKPKWPIIVRPRPIWYPVATPVAVAAPTYVVSRPVISRPGPCTCLSKEYTQEGAVLFKDRCTSEMAINPPLQAPQQTGAVVQPQQYTR